MRTNFKPIKKINKILKFQSPIRRNLLKKKKILFFEVQFAGTFSEIMKKCLKIVRQIPNKAKKWIFSEGDTGKSPHQKTQLSSKFW